MATSYVIFGAKDREFLSKEVSAHVAETVNDQTRALDAALTESALLFCSGEYQRVSVHRRDERGQTWLRSWVETKNPNEAI